MSYERVTPRARQGTTGICEEMDVTAGNGVWKPRPDRKVIINLPSTVEMSMPQP